MALSETENHLLRRLLKDYANQELQVAENNASPVSVDAAYQRRDAALLIVEDLSSVIG